MNIQLKKSVKVYLLILTIFASHFGAFAQKPPTAGPNPSPSDPVNLGPIIIGVGGVALGTASYFYLKSRGPKIAVRDHLPDYLLNRNILPSPDAVDLIYKLNPALNNRESMRAKKKIVGPDFPIIPADQIISSINSVQFGTFIPGPLKEQIDGFKSNLNIFRLNKLTINAVVQNVNMDSLYSVLNEIEKTITSPAWIEEESNSVKNQLMIDLLTVLNQTLVKTLANKVLAEQETLLIREISDNLWELLFPVIRNQAQSLKNKQPQNGGLPREEYIFYASVGTFPVLNTNQGFESSNHTAVPIGDEDIDKRINTNMLKGFAFAVYKIDASGEIITRGPEVERRYLIKYVSPALKSFPGAYHNLTPLATYASAYMPPAKLFFTVVDINGKEVALHNPIIDLKDAFIHPQGEQINEMIIVPIYVSR